MAAVHAVDKKKNHDVLHYQHRNTVPTVTHELKLIKKLEMNWNTLKNKQKKKK